MRDTRYHRRQDFTDTCLLIGPNLRWVEDDYEDLQHTHPEVFLGYNVILVPASTVGTTMRGRRIAKIVVLDGDYGMWSNLRIVDAMHGACQWDLGTTKVEEWHVHGPNDTYRIS